MLEPVGVDVALDLDLHTLKMGVKRGVAAPSVHTLDLHGAGELTASAAGVDDEIGLFGEARGIERVL